MNKSDRSHLGGAVKNPKRKRGSALVATLVIVSLLAGLGAAFATYLFAYIRSTEAMMVPVVAAYSAEAGLEKLWHDISKSAYTGNGVNIWLTGDGAFALAHSHIIANQTATGPYCLPPGDPANPMNPPPADPLAWQRGVTFGQARIRGRCIDLNTGDRRHLAVIYAWYMPNSIDMNVLIPNRPPDAIVAQEFQANVSFTSFAFLTSNQDLSFSGNVTVKGNVQSNKAVNFYSTFQKTFEKDVKAGLGFVYAYGGAPANTTILGNAVPNAAQIALPDGAIIMPTLKGFSTDPYSTSTQAMWDEPPIDGVMVPVNDTYVTFGPPDRINVSVKNRSTGVTTALGNFPAPVNGILYTTGDMHIGSAAAGSGDTTMKITFASEMKTYLDNSIRILDAQGDPASILSNGGTPIVDVNNPASFPFGHAPTEPFTSAYGYNYEENPAFDNNPAIRGAVGIVSMGDVEVSTLAPFNMELMGAVLSLTGKFTANVSAGNTKGNLMTLGSFATYFAGVRIQYGPPDTGYILSGRYLFDEGLTLGPPPQYPGTTQAGQGVRWKATVQELSSLDVDLVR